MRWPWTTKEDRRINRHIIICHNIMMDFIAYHKNPLTGKPPRSIAENMQKTLNDWYETS